MADSSPTPAVHELRGPDGKPTKDRPWMFRTYAGHTSAKASNALFLENLERGQTGLSIAFDLPTQCGYTSDDPLALPEVGKVGVPINSLDDFHVLFANIPLERMNTSMTINATSMWLLALYVGLARERGVDPKSLRGTTQNDIVKEYLARGTYIFPPEPSLGLIAELYEYSLVELPHWNASNICSYHLQEAGADPAQELAFALANAVGVLDLVRARGKFDDAGFAQIVGRMSFFVNAGVRFIEEMCKMRAFTQMWDRITVERYGITDPKLRRFRYGVQVNSLGLTEAQPENNAWRILIEALGVTLSRNARCRALQLPAWNEAMSLPRPWDQQWSLRLQQILAYETDLLEYPDLFDGSPVIESKVNALIAKAERELAVIQEMGGVAAAVESGYMKSALVRSMASRIERIADGTLPVIGVNQFTDGLPSPLLGGDDGGVFRVERDAVEETFAALSATRAHRDDAAVVRTLAELKSAAQRGDPLMEPSIACALARVTTGEWAGVLREVYGEYRPATGIEGQVIALPRTTAAPLAVRMSAFVTTRGRRPRLLVGKPGLDGHSNGAEVIAVAAKNAGFDVVFAGIRLSPAELATSAAEEDVDLIGLSILSGSHLELVDELVGELAARGVTDVPLVVGGIVPPADIESLQARGVAKVFTPSDHDLGALMTTLFDLIEGHESRPSSEVGADSEATP